jgi:hypothetical protein
MNNGNIILGYSQKDNNFKIYDQNKLLGVFGIINIIKYVTSDLSKTFLSTIEFESFAEIIKKYLFKLDLSINNISVIGHLESPLTGNIEIMMKIYQDLVKFNQNMLQNELNTTENNEIKNKIIKRIRNFEYVVLNHSLKIIVNISNAIKNDTTKKELKNSLIKYSVFITNKINNIICENLNDTKNDVTIFNSELTQLKKNKNNIEIKIKKIEEKINAQDAKINKIIDYIDIDNIDDIINEYEKINKSNIIENNNINNDNLNVIINKNSDENINNDENINSDDKINSENQFAGNQLDEIFFNDSENGYSPELKSPKNIDGSNINYLTPEEDK